MKLSTKLFAGLLTCGITSTACASGNSVKFDETRLVIIANMIEPRISLAAANTIEAHASGPADKPKLPIDILINSPGGSVMAGGFVLDAINLAKSRGYVVRCHTAVLAASMAFSIYNACSERYAFPNSALLFHPARVYVEGALGAKDAAFIAVELQALNDALIAELVGSLGMGLEEVTYAFYMEKMWTGTELAAAAKPGYITVVTDIEGIEYPFEISGMKGDQGMNGQTKPGVPSGKK